MKVYVYQGREGEKVPETVEKLIVKEGVQVLPLSICEAYELLQEVSLPNGLTTIEEAAFNYCKRLRKVSINSTVCIGEGAFRECDRLKKVEFESAPASLQQLQTIDEGSFHSCTSLKRIKLPPSVTSVGAYIFFGCQALVEADLSTCEVQKIPSFAFMLCGSLRCVSLPKMVEQICNGAFLNCQELVTVVVPVDDSNESIKLGSETFYHCRRLANFVLPKDSSAEEDSFDGCELLYGCYGIDSSRIVAGLMERFENLPIHKMCYFHSGTTVQGLRQCITDQEEILLLDQFGMTPFHILFSTIEPRMELLTVLLETFSNHQALKRKDSNGRRPVDYLLNNWTDLSKRLVQKVLQQSMIDPLENWGAASWKKDMEHKVQDIMLAAADRRQRQTLHEQLYTALERYENLESTSILEMTLWKWRLKSSGWIAHDDSAITLDRVQCRLLNGSDIVIPLVTMFLGIGRGISEED